MPHEQRLLTPPDVRPVRFSKNFIKTAVCELRFPALLELEARPPHAFQKAIRKTYPNYEPQLVEMGMGEEAMRESRYLFRSTDKHWTVSVKSSALSLETTKYTDFEDFFERLSILLRNAEPLIDADFFTRIGLRYINSVPIQDGDPRNWINKDLLTPFENDVLGSLKNYRCILAGSIQDGSYTVRHGLGAEDNAAEVGVSKREYTLDFDYFSENVEAAVVPDRIQSFHRTNFALFNWCLGPKAKATLGEGRPK